MSVHTVDMTASPPVFVAASYGSERRGIWVTAYRRNVGVGIAVAGKKVPTSKAHSAHEASAPGTSDVSFLPSIHALTEALASGRAAPTFGEHLRLAQSAIRVNERDRTPVSTWAKNLIGSMFGK